MQISHLVHGRKVCLSGVQADQGTSASIKEVVGLVAAQLQQVAA